MEKRSKRTKAFIRAGLLAALAFFCSGTLSSQEARRSWFSREDAQKLQVVPKDDIFFTNKEAQFILQIPQILPSDVQTELPNFPDGVIFNSSKRGEYFSSEGIMGAEIDLWFTFRKTGSITLPPLIIYVQGRRFAIDFKTVEVYENPRTILPKMTLVFEGGQVLGEETKSVPTITLRANEKTRFTIYLQYAIQAQQFAWSIPKDSLFRETKRYETTTKNEKATEFSTKKIPVADFEWIPFAAGTTSLPDIRMMATAYSGRSIYLSVPECVVNITSSKKDAIDKKNEPDEAGSVYAYAWAPAAADNKEDERKIASPFDCGEIARLRSLERHAFLSIAKRRAERVAAEKAIGLQSAENEPPLCLLYIILGADAILLLLSIIFLALKKRFEAALIGIAFIGLSFVCAIDANILLKRRGVIVGGEISPVPEESAMTKTAVSGGSRVLIEQEIQGWYYIVYNESGGWIKKENLAVIK